MDRKRILVVGGVAGGASWILNPASSTLGICKVIPLALETASNRFLTMIIFTFRHIIVHIVEHFLSFSPSNVGFCF